MSCFFPGEQIYVLSRLPDSIEGACIYNLNRTFAVIILL